MAALTPTTRAGTETNFAALCAERNGAHRSFQIGATMVSATAISASVSPRAPFHGKCSGNFFKGPLVLSSSVVLFTQVHFEKAKL